MEPNWKRRERYLRKQPGCAVDHDHDTGAVRGILCRPCNAALGALGDNTETLRRAFDYIHHHKHGGLKCL